jgi:hypothetical protein
MSSFSLTMWPLLFMVALPSELVAFLTAWMRNATKEFAVQ